MDTALNIDRFVAGVTAAADLHGPKEAASRLGRDYERGHQTKAHQ